MASLTKIFMTRVKLKKRKMGRKRKNHLANHGSTPTREAFFGDVTEAKTTPRAD